MSGWRCPVCGTDNDALAKLCKCCGAMVSAEVRARQARRVLTVQGLITILEAAGVVYEDRGGVYNSNIDGTDLRGFIKHAVAAINEFFNDPSNPEGTP